MIPAYNQNKPESSFKSALLQLLILLINFIGFIGISLIIYALVVFYLKESWVLLDNIANKTSFLCTLVGTMITSISIYLPPNTRHPEPISKFFIAPSIIIFCIVILLLYFRYSFEFPSHLVNGVAILGISGALFRLVSRNVVND